MPPLDLPSERQAAIAKLIERAAFRAGVDLSRNAPAMTKDDLTPALALTLKLTDKEGRLLE
jgi:hypothetical protein